MRVKPSKGEVLEYAQDLAEEYGEMGSPEVDPHKRYDSHDQQDPYGQAIHRAYERGVKIFGRQQ